MTKNVMQAAMLMREKEAEIQLHLCIVYASSQASCTTEQMNAPSVVSMIRIMFRPCIRDELVVDSNPFIRDSGGGTKRGIIPADVCSDMLATRVCNVGMNPCDVWID